MEFICSNRCTVQVGCLRCIYRWFGLVSIYRILCSPLPKVKDPSPSRLLINPGLSARLVLLSCNKPIFPFNGPMSKAPGARCPIYTVPHIYCNCKDGYGHQVIRALIKHGSHTALTHCYAAIPTSTVREIYKTRGRISAPLKRPPLHCQRSPSFSHILTGV